MLQNKFRFIFLFSFDIKFGIYNIRITILWHITISLILIVWYYYNFNSSHINKINEFEGEHLTKTTYPFFIMTSCENNINLLSM